MILRTIQWNIGGGKIRNEEEPADGSYLHDGMQYIQDILKEYRPHIVFFQETHADAKTVQAEQIAAELGYSYVTNDVYDASHITEGQGLGQAFLSQFPIERHHFDFFINPHYELERPDGTVWKSHNKGASRCIATLPDNIRIELMTLHMIPFRKFGVDPFSENLQPLRENIQNTLHTSEPLFLLQGDFNIDDSSLKYFLPNILRKNSSEVILQQPTTPKGRKYDHIIYRGLKHLKSEVLSTALTDHYPIYSEFEIPSV